MQWWKQAVFGFEHGETDRHPGGDPWIALIPLPRHEPS